MTGNGPFDAPPVDVTIGGRVLPVDSDFRMGVAIELEALSGKPDAAGLLRRFFLGEIPADVPAAAEAMLAFYRGPDAEERRAGDGRKGRWYDYAQDADAIKASFLAAYRIDLTTARLHWWLFRALLLHLPPETPFMTRVRYRSADLKQLSGAERKHYRKMQQIYALERRSVPQTTEERDAALLEQVRRYKEAQQHAERPR